MTDGIKKILIAEDTPEIAKAVIFALEDAGYKIDSVQDGAEALEKIKKENYDLVILDLVMPSITGFDVLNDLKFNNNKTPIYVYSNMLEDCTKEDVLNAGARAFLNKSKISLDELLEEVKNFFKE